MIKVYVTSCDGYTKRRHESRRVRTSVKKLTPKTSKLWCRKEKGSEANVV